MCSLKMGTCVVFDFPFYVEKELLQNVTLVYCPVNQKMWWAKMDAVDPGNYIGEQKYTFLLTF